MMNLLEMVLPMISGVIDSSSGVFEYRNYIGQTKNNMGIVKAQYSEWKTCQGSVQPIQKSKYAAMGLDFSKTYYTFWGSIILHGIDETQNGADQIRLPDGRILIVDSDTDWVNVDGWRSFVCYVDKRKNGGN